jgi:hypothetical protein
MAWPKGVGKNPGSGRKSGVPNKVTGELRAMVLQALSESGGVEYLKRVAKENPAPFLALVGKCLPKDITVAGDPEQPVLTSIRIELVKSNGAGKPLEKEKGEV